MLHAGMAERGYQDVNVSIEPLQPQRKCSVNEKATRV